jgi:peroxiredoxin
LWRQREELRSLGIDVLLVSFEPLARAREYSVEDGFGWPVLADESGAAYASYGLERASFLRAWLSPKTVRFYLSSALRGRRIRKPVSDTSQLGGDFLIDPDGRIVFAFRSAEPADRPSVEQITSSRHRTGHEPAR